MMFSAYRQIDKNAEQSRLLLLMVIVLAVLNLSLVGVIATSPSRFEFWLAPSAINEGGDIKPNDIKSEYVYAFVSTFMPLMGTWQKGGVDGYKKQVHSFHYYFTPRHRQLLSDAFNAYKNTSFFERAQTSSLYRQIEPKDVRQIAPNLWSVHLVMRVTQRLNDSDEMLVSDKVVDYHVRVVKASVSKAHNPFQLALDGYTQKERLEKDLLEGVHNA